MEKYKCYSCYDTGLWVDKNKVPYIVIDEDGEECKDKNGNYIEFVCLDCVWSLPYRF